jgi:hypothetical protein
LDGIVDDQIEDSKRNAPLSKELNLSGELHLQERKEKRKKTQFSNTYDTRQNQWMPG